MRGGSTGKQKIYIRVRDPNHLMIFITIHVRAKKCLRKTLGASPILGIRARACSLRREMFLSSCKSGSFGLKTRGLSQKSGPSTKRFAHFPSKAEFQCDSLTSGFQPAAFPAIFWGVPSAASFETDLSGVSAWDEKPP